MAQRGTRHLISTRDADYLYWAHSAKEMVPGVFLHIAVFLVVGEWDFVTFLQHRCDFNYICICHTGSDHMYEKSSLVSGILLPFCNIAVTLTIYIYICHTDSDHLYEKSSLVSGILLPFCNIAVTLTICICHTGNDHLYEKSSLMSGIVLPFCNIAVTLTILYIRHAGSDHIYEKSSLMNGILLPFCNIAVTLYIYVTLVVTRSSV